MDLGDPGGRDAHRIAEKGCVSRPLLQPLCLHRRHTVECDWLRGIHMDIDHGLSRLPVLGTSLKGRCGSCATAQRAADPRSRRPTEHVDEDVFVISGPELDGWVVVPRPHISGLEELSIPHRASVLAALRRATRSVRQRNPWSTPTIVVRTDLPASEGHVCFQVLPWVPDYAMDSRTRFGCARLSPGPIPANPGCFGVPTVAVAGVVRTTNEQQVSTDGVPSQRRDNKTLSS